MKNSYEHDGLFASPCGLNSECHLPSHNLVHALCLKRFEYDPVMPQRVAGHGKHSRSMSTGSRHYRRLVPWLQEHEINADEAGAYDISFLEKLASSHVPKPSARCSRHQDSVLRSCVNSCTVSCTRPSQICAFESTRLPTRCKRFHD